MKKLILILSLFFVLCISANAQDCPADYVNRCSKAFDEVVELRKTVDQFLVERKTNEAERASANALIKSLNEILAIKDLKETELNKLSAIKDRIIEIQAKIIDTLEKALNKPKSAFAKFLQGVKQVLILASGILIGRGL